MGFIKTKKKFYVKDTIRNVKILVIGKPSQITNPTIVSEYTQQQKGKVNLKHESMAPIDI